MGGGAPEAPGCRRTPGGPISLDQNFLVNEVSIDSYDALPLPFSEYTVCEASHTGQVVVKAC